VIAVKDSVAVIEKNFPGTRLLHEGYNYGVSMLTPEFLDPATREAACGKYAILELPPPPVRRW
jgi:hypothetical protein